jgi:hypothetical protein
MPGSGDHRKRAARGDRLADALRANLRRRKAQARGRAVSPVPQAEPAERTGPAAFDRLDPKSS